MRRNKDASLFDHVSAQIAQHLQTRFTFLPEPAASTP
jgi:hypothetical protein